MTSNCLASLISTHKSSPRLRTPPPQSPPSPHSSHPALILHTQVPPRAPHYFAFSKEYAIQLQMYKNCIDYNALPGM